MAAVGGGAKSKGSSPPLKPPPRFAVYQNPALSAALTASSLRPSRSIFLCIFSLTSASAFVLLSIISWESWFIDNLKLRNVSHQAAYLFSKVIEGLVGLAFFGTMVALIRVISLLRARNATGVPVLPSSKGNKEQMHLTNHQLELLGIKPIVEQESQKKPPKSKTHLASSQFDFLVPLHQAVTTTNRPSQVGADKSNNSGGHRVRSFGTPSKSPGSPSLYFAAAAPSQTTSSQNSPGLDLLVSTPWSNKRGSSTKKITSEEKLEQFLADVDEKFTESAGKLATPPPTISGFGIASPNTIATSANTSGTTRSTPLRPVRMSPGSQKFSTPPKKGEGDLPLPMSIEEAIEAFERLGIYPQIEHWRDRLRQWFSSVLLNPLLNKIESSHIQVMQSVAKLRISIAISPVGSDLPTAAAGTLASVSSIDRSKEWQPTFTPDEDGLLHQLRASLAQALDSSISKFPLSNLQQSPQQQSMIPIIQECVDAITEHQRLHALMKGELVKGLLPQSSVRAEYMVQRIRELAEGTCLKNYEYLGNGEVYDKVNKKWTSELPSDSHLLLYLFCAFLEHPKWMLHVDPTSYTGAQSSKNPLFLGVLPPKDRFPEKYIAIVSGVPSTLHPGSCILAVGKKSPPIYALYCDKKLQFSLQGRTALWDSILLLCHRIKLGYGGIVRGMHLGSSALRINSIFEPEIED